MENTLLTDFKAIEAENFHHVLYHFQLYFKILGGRIHSKHKILFMQEMFHILPMG